MTIAIEGELILISSRDFIEAMKSLDDQINATQGAISMNTALVNEALAKIDLILRGN